MSSIPAIRRLLICGASARAAAWSSRIAGFQVVAADLFADTDLCEFARVFRIPAVQYPAGFVNLARRIVATETIDGWIYTGGLENHPAVIDQVSEILPLLGNGRAALEIVRDPFRLSELFAEAGVPVPELELSDRGLSRGKRWLIKPRASAGGRGIQLVDRSRETFNEARGDDARGNDEAHSQGVTHVFQEFIDGPTYAGVFVGDSGQSQLLGVTRLWTRRDLDVARRDDSEGSEQHDFQYVGSTGPVELVEDVAKQWLRIGDLLARKAGLVGLFGVDAVVAQRGRGPTVCPIEVNPRYTSSIEILERAFGHSFMQQHIAACESGGLRASATKSIPESAPGQYWGKRILFANRRSAYDDAMASRLSTPPPGVTEWHLADIPAIGTSIKPHAPILTTIAASDSLVAVQKALGFPEC